LKLVEIVPVTAGTDANTVVCSSLIDLDASAAKYANRIARAVAGNVSGETKRVRNIANAGYVPASGTLNFGGDFSATPNTSTSLELWRAVQDDDPSILIDEAMQRSRRRLWWEETFYFSVDEGITEYNMPPFMLDGSVKSVDFAADTYPTHPDWRPVGWWNLAMDMGQPLLTVKQSSIGNLAYGAGQVIRAVYNRFGDRMDDDVDSWGVALEWAIAETALEYLKTVRTPGGGKEDVSDATVAKAEVADDCMEWRKTYMPTARIQVRNAR
jgi:hypothetical protein